MTVTGAPVYGEAFESDLAHLLHHAALEAAIDTGGVGQPLILRADPGQTEPTLLIQDEDGEQFFAVGQGVDDPLTSDGWVFGSLLNVGLEDYYAVQQAVNPNDVSKVSRWYVENESDDSDQYGLIEMGLDGLKQFRYYLSAPGHDTTSTLTLTGVVGQTTEILDIQTDAGAHVLRATNDSKIGLFGVAAVARRAAYVQTYATALRTVNNPSAAAVSATASTNVGPYGYAQAQADAVLATINQLVLDTRELRQVLNSLIDDSQAIGITA